jgi:AmiR/NasT family two-component response regulator
MASSSAELESAQLRRALQSRDVIGQAKGILMERRGISADEAFAVLRAASQSLNVKLTQVARTLVERRDDL